MPGVEIIATFERKNNANFPLIKAEDALGAFVTVADVAARDAIVTGALRTGALVRIGTTSNFYEWTGSAWALFSGFGSSGHIIEDEGVALTPRSSLNFVGVNVTVSDSGGKTVVTIGAVSLASGVSGVLPTTNGGTGLSTVGSNGQILTIVGGVPAWATPGGGSLTAPASPGDNGKVAVAASGNLSYTLLSGTHLSASANVALSQLANGGACSVVGRSANSSGAHADIAAGSDGQVLRRSGGVLGFGTIETAGIGDSQVTLPKLADGTAVSLVGRAANSTGVYADIQANANGLVFLRRSNALTAATLIDENIDAAAGISWSKMAAVAALTVLANATNASASPTALAFANDGDMLMRSGTALVAAKVANANVASNANIDGSKINPAFTANVSITQPVSTSGSPKAFTVVGAAHTNLAASTQAPDVDFNLARTVQFATGAFTGGLRAVRITPPTYAFAGASAVDVAATLAIGGAPVAGTNATLTRSVALWLESGNVKLGTDTSVAAATAPSTTFFAANATGTGATVGGKFQFQVGAGATEGSFEILDSLGSSLMGVGRSSAQYVLSIGSSSSTTSILNFLNTLPNALPCVVQVQTTANNDGRTLLIAGQAAQVNGGELILAGGRGLTAHGSVTIRLGAYVNGIISGGTAHTMFQAAHLASGARRVTALNYPGTGGAGVTTTEMGANTGDLVTFVGDCQTNGAVPSADAGNGHVYYSDSGKPGWRFNSTNFRLNGTHASASAGAGAALPATVQGYLDVQINGTQRKIPYYAA